MNTKTNMKREETNEMKINCIERFNALSKANLEALLEKHPTSKHEVKVHATKTCELHPHAGYTLEFFKHSIHGHWRITKGTERHRVAWGMKVEELDNLLSDRPTSWRANKKEPGNQFSFFPCPLSDEREKVVFLLHGMGVRAKSMEKLARALEKENFQVCNYDYLTSTPGGDEQIGEEFLEKLKDFWKKHDLYNKKVYFLTHSNGGIVLRVALNAMTEKMRRHIKAIVMLGPPNQGSGWADILSLVTSNKVVQDLSARPDSFANTLPVPDDMPSVGIIRGRLDCKVSEKRAHLPGNCEDDFVTCKGNHPGERNPKNTLSYILTFFEEGHF